MTNVTHNFGELSSKTAHTLVGQLIISCLYLQEDRYINLICFCSNVMLLELWNSHSCGNVGHVYSYCISGIDKQGLNRYVVAFQLSFRYLCQLLSFLFRFITKSCLVLPFAFLVVWWHMCFISCLLHSLLALHELCQLFGEHRKSKTSLRVNGWGGCWFLKSLP